MLTLETFEEASEIVKKVTQETKLVKSAYFTELTGLNPSSVGITHAKTRFGSCSGKNSINFSVYLFAYPDDVIDYVMDFPTRLPETAGTCQDIFTKIIDFD